MGKKSSSTPDVVGAANAEGEFSRETTRDQTYANRPDQYNAMGSNTWNQEMVRDPATGEMTTKWTQRQNLSPEMQKLFDQDMYTNQKLGGTAASLTNRVDAEMGTAPDWEQFGDVIGMPTGGYDDYRSAAEDAAYGRSTQRLDPQFEADRQALEIRLRNRGLAAGDQQYQSEMESFNTGRNDAYEMARMGATSEGRDETQLAFGTDMASNERANALRSQQIAEYQAKRGQSLSDLNALKSSQTTGEMTSNYGGA